MCKHQVQYESWLNWFLQCYILHFSYEILFVTNCCVLKQLLQNHFCPMSNFFGMIWSEPVKLSLGHEYYSSAKYLTRAIQTFKIEDVT